MDGERAESKEEKKTSSPALLPLLIFFSFVFCVSRVFGRQKTFWCFFDQNPKHKKFKMKVPSLRNNTTNLRALAAHCKTHDARQRQSINQSIDKSWAIQPSLARTRKTKATCTAKPDEAKDRTDQTLRGRRTSAWPRRRLWRSRERKTLWRESWGTTYRAKKAKSSSGGW